MTESRPSGVRATGSSAERFRSARIKLTLLYLAIIVAIVALLSSTLYEFHSHDLERIDRGRAVPELRSDGPSPGETPSIGEYLESLGRSIIFADIITIIAAGGLSWLLATRTLRPLRHAVEAEQRFYANAAHDLRTPLAVMRSEAEVSLRSGAVRGHARKVIESSLEEVARMSTMVEQMLDLARSGVSGAARVPSMERVDLAEMARALSAKLARRAQSVGVRLATRASASAPVSGNAFALERAVYNVLENALAYTPAGGSITVDVRKAGAQVILAVADTGIGIDRDDLPRITEPFFRGDLARGAHSGGAGLGLTIARTIVEEHRGSLAAESSPGAGTTITFRFPAV
jgi:two-component system, OmpR family, sensor histidine kinase CiaH